MRISKAFLWMSLVVVLVSSMASGTVTYAWDSGKCTNPLGEISWGNADTLSLNVFNVDPANNTIDKLEVAWGNLPANTTARVILYAMQDGTSLPGWGAVTMFSVLQVVNTTVLSGQANDFPAATPVWTTYNITPTAITTQRFAVATIAANPDANTVSTTFVDTDTNVAGPDISFIGCCDPISNDLHQLGAGDSNDVGGFASYGYANNPFLIRAEGVGPIPEPITMALVGMGIAALGGYIRRRHVAAK